MADFRSEIVTNFLLNNCLSRQRLNFEALGSFVAEWTAQRAFNNTGIAYVTTTTGSCVEFYIQPKLSCVGDVDLMYYRCHELAIPTGTAPPTQLPGEFDNRVEVCEIVDSEFPGYVYLVTSYLLTECIDDGKYKVAE